MMTANELPRKTAKGFYFHVDSARIEYTDGDEAEIGRALVTFLPGIGVHFEDAPALPQLKFTPTQVQSTSVPPPTPTPLPKPKGWPARLNAAIEAAAERPEWKRFDLWAKDITRTALAVFAVYLVCEVVHAFASGAVDRAIR